MIDTPAFEGLLREHGYALFSGVPCSLLQPLINLASNSLDYVAAANEGEAVAIAVGAELGGKRSAVLLQNSGLANALAPLTSLTNIYAVPITGFVGYRGEAGTPDEIQHEFMGRITAQLLETCGVRVIHLATDLAAAAMQLQEGQECLAAGQSVFYLVSKGTFSPLALEPSAGQGRRNGSVQIAEKTGRTKPSRHAVLESINGEKCPEAVVLATTGMCGRELFTISDASNHLYMVGSMGCVSSIGLGLAIARPKRPVIALDGDGALLMRMGNLATNAYYAPDNLLHVLLDNETHDSTGGQATASTCMDWPTVAHGAGYPRVVQACSVAEVDQALADWLNAPCLTFLHVPIAPGSISPLGRPTVAPADVAQRLKDFLQ